MKSNEIEMSEQQAVNLVRNSLLVAGAEMGKDGDHWPVIKSTVHELMKDYEHLKVERNVDAELKIQLYSQLEIMERGVADCTPDVRPGLVSKLKELRDLFDSYFSAVDLKAAPIQENEIPAYLKRARIIVDTLEEEHA